MEARPPPRSQRGDTRVAPAATAGPPQLLGDLKLLDYCQAQGWEESSFGVPNSRPHAAVNNWRCATGDTSLPINMEET